MIADFRDAKGGHNMLLNYLFAHFYEEREFTTVTGYCLDDLRSIIDARLVPDASYLLECDLRSMTTVGDFRARSAYRFHLKTHLEWTVALERLSLDTERRARRGLCRASSLARLRVPKSGGDIAGTGAICGDHAV